MGSCDKPIVAGNGFFSCATRHRFHSVTGIGRHPGQRRHPGRAGRRGAGRRRRRDGERRDAAPGRLLHGGRPGAHPHQQRHAVGRRRRRLVGRGRPRHPRLRHREHRRRSGPHAHATDGPDGRGLHLLGGEGGRRVGPGGAQLLRRGCQRLLLDAAGGRVAGRVHRFRLPELQHPERGGHGDGGDGLPEQQRRAGGDAERRRHGLRAGGRRRDGRDRGRPGRGAGLHAGRRNGLHPHQPQRRRRAGHGRLHRPVRGRPAHHRRPHLRRRHLPDQLPGRRRRPGRHPDYRGRGRLDGGGAGRELERRRQLAGRRSAVAGGHPDLPVGRRQRHHQQRLPSGHGVRGHPGVRRRLHAGRRRRHAGRRRPVRRRRRNDDGLPAHHPRGGDIPRQQRAGRTGRHRRHRPERQPADAGRQRHGGNRRRRVGGRRPGQGGRRRGGAGRRQRLHGRHPGQRRHPGRAGRRGAGRRRRRDGERRDAAPGRLLHGGRPGAHPHQQRHAVGRRRRRLVGRGRPRHPRLRHREHRRRSGPHAHATDGPDGRGLHLLGGEGGRRVGPGGAQLLRRGCQRLLLDAAGGRVAGRVHRFRLPELQHPERGGHGDGGDGLPEQQRRAWRRR